MPFQDYVMQDAAPERPDFSTHKKTACDEQAVS
jgi:hypothetical protein